jgi:hypothetical protein
MAEFDLTKSNGFDFLCHHLPRKSATDGPIAPAARIISDSALICELPNGRLGWVSQP